MIKQTEDEWLLEMSKRFPNLRKATFECPQCGHVQPIEDFLNLNLDTTRAYKDCLGRFRL
ncbi:VVA0879 family protein [Thermoactinomyces sp. CICC 10522]|uniref:VVA0879 family protein n=1 Tax=Thermoactinomyces sp. CICC 10522 TaxID=2767427 RepID=UPI00351C2A3C